MASPSPAGATSASQAEARKNDRIVAASDSTQALHGLDLGRTERARRGGSRD